MTTYWYPSIDSLGTGPARSVFSPSAGELLLLYQGLDFEFAQIFPVYILHTPDLA